MGAALFLLPWYRPLGGGTASGDTLRFLHHRWNRESGRLAGWAAAGIRTSSFLWGADGEGFPAECQPHGQSDDVVGGSDVFRSGPNPGGVLGVAFGRSAWLAVFFDRVGMVGWNIVEQLEEPHGRLFQGPAGPRQFLRDRRPCYGNAGDYSGGISFLRVSFDNPGYSGSRLWVKQAYGFPNCLHS